MRRITVAITIMTLGVLGAIALTTPAQAAPAPMIGAVDQINREVVILDQNAPKWGKDVGVKWR
jgi:hypothetical protein